MRVWIGVICEIWWRRKDRKRTYLQTTKWEWHASAMLHPGGKAWTICSIHDRRELCNLVYNQPWDFFVVLEQIQRSNCIIQIASTTLRTAMRRRRWTAVSSWSITVATIPSPLQGIDIRYLDVSRDFLCSQILVGSDTRRLCHFDLDYHDNEIDVCVAILYHPTPWSSNGNSNPKWDENVVYLCHVSVMRDS